MSSIPRVVIHGGAGTPESWSDGCEQAAEVAIRSLEETGDALHAAVAAAVSLENDGRFNAGCGSTLRLDGETIEMDASIMTSDGRMGAVGAVRNLPNPILLAREVYTTPHMLLVGPGAEALARQRGIPTAPVEPSERARQRVERLRGKIAPGGDLGRVNPLWSGTDARDFWNFGDSPPGWLDGCDTIGAVVRDGRGTFAVTNSTGGATPMLLGRVGDTPLPGAGFWCGPAGAVCSTGIGEEIARRLLSKQVYDWLEEGMKPEEACRRGCDLFPEKFHVGVIAITAEGAGSASNTTMAGARA